jgi:hypothetical protein
MAIVIERTATSAPPPAPVVHRVVVRPPAPVPVVTVLPAVQAAAWVPIHHVRTSSSFSSEDSAGVAAASLGLVASATLASQGFGATPLLVAGSLAVVAVGVILAVLERRRRRQCAG